MTFIIAVWMFSQGVSFQFFNMFNERNLLFFTVVYALTQPTSIVVKFLISRWTPSEVASASEIFESSESLENAGKYIGIMERLFVFGFVVSGNWQAIGFLLAAKSVFRFGNLKESKERKLTEYVLIGTLLSFGLAMLAGVIYTYMRGCMCC